LCLFYSASYNEARSKLKSATVTSDLSDFEPSPSNSKTRARICTPHLPTPPARFSNLQTTGFADFEALEISPSAAASSEDRHDNDGAGLDSVGLLHNQEASYFVIALPVTTDAFVQTDIGPEKSNFLIF